MSSLFIRKIKKEIAYITYVIVEKYKKCSKNNPLTPFDKGE